MRKTILLLALAPALAAGPLPPAVERVFPTDVGPGRVAWFDLTTSDLPRSREFYGKVFDWQFAAVPGTDLAVQIVSRGGAIGTLRRAEGKISPFNGVVYIQVGDIQASLEQVKRLGGKVIPGFPFNLSDGTGAIGLVLDPVGHPLGLYSRTPVKPVQP
jgi:predicted enzyme related to lactoylglutathione lyase